MKQLVWLAALVVLAVGCTPVRGGTPAPPAVPAYEVLQVAGDGGQLNFPRQTAQGDVMDALLVGTLAEVDGCVRVIAETGQDDYLPIWPPGFALEAIDGVLAVRDPDGQPLVRLGDTVSLSGGELPEGHAGPQALGCPGQYWLVGSTVGPAGP